MARTGKNIYKRKDGRYEGRYIVSRDEKGKAKYACVYGKSAHEVEAKLIEKRAEVRAETMQGLNIFSEIAKEWLDSRRETLTEATIDRYEFILERYFLPEFGERDINDVKMIQMDTYIADLSDEQKHGDSAISGTMLENLRTIANAVLSYAENRDKQYPTLSSMVTIEKESYHSLTADEIRRLVACANYNKCPDMLGVLLSLYTGIGTGELCALSWDDIDPDRREISIRHTLYRVKDKNEDSIKKSKLIVTDVRKSAVRTVSYPTALAEYVSQFYTPGTVFLSCEAHKYVEPRTFCNHIERAFSLYKLDGVTLQRVKKTYQEGLASVRYLTDPFYQKETAEVSLNLDEKWLLKEMENDLAALRSILGISGSDMGQLMAISEDEYMALEAGETTMDWNAFLALLFVFKYNSKTEGVVDALGLYPSALKEKIAITG